jgi:glycosyltransferase involved in cell wall biosynthesis
MLIILSTHPIQYQVPLWQALAADGRVPFEVWYMSDHATKVSHDAEFGTRFAWDLDMLSGYPHRFLKGADSVNPSDFWNCRLHQDLADQLRQVGAKALWIQGWQVAGYWQAVKAARSLGIEVWLRGESNDLSPARGWKKVVKRQVLGWLFSNVDKFLCIGTGNRRLYESYGVPPDLLFSAPYCVDNARFYQQAEVLRPRRAELRRAWGIPEGAFCPLFCGKFIPKKRPMDLVLAAQRLLENDPNSPIHLLFAGSGELGPELRAACSVAFDAESLNIQRSTFNVQSPPASFLGFLNQTRISEAYVAADCLVLPSDFGETWGLVVNEAMASGLPCIISDRCGSAEDLGTRSPNQTFSFANATSLKDALQRLTIRPPVVPGYLDDLQGFTFPDCVAGIANAWKALPAPIVPLPANGVIKSNPVTLQ